MNFAPPQGPPLGIMCPQCGLMHPPLKPGEICPMKKQLTQSGEVIDIEKFMQAMRSIVLSNIQKKNLKNYKKFLAYILVKITKIAEYYNEGEELKDVGKKN